MCGAGPNDQLPRGRRRLGPGGFWEEMEVDLPQDRFSEREAAFIAARDSFYMASISESGWPNLQH